MLFDVNTSFGKKMQVYEMALNATLLRSEVLADNIANADTPYFKRSDVTFESQLKRAFDSEKKPEFPNLMTNKRHITFNEVIDFKTVKPRIQVDYDTSYRNDKNNVDIEKESIESSKTAMQYTAMLELYSRNIRILNIAMR